jgi:hypothetical protein
MKPQQTNQFSNNLTNITESVNSFYSKLSNFFVTPPYTNLDTLVSVSNKTAVAENSVENESIKESKYHLQKVSSLNGNIVSTKSEISGNKKDTSEEHKDENEDETIEKKENLTNQSHISESSLSTDSKNSTFPSSVSVDSLELGEPNQLLPETEILEEQKLIPIVKESILQKNLEQPKVSINNLIKIKSKSERMISSLNTRKDGQLLPPRSRTYQVSFELNNTGKKFENKSTQVNQDIIIKNNFSVHSELQSCLETSNKNEPDEFDRFSELIENQMMKKSNCCEDCAFIKAEIEQLKLDFNAIKLEFRSNRQSSETSNKHKRASSATINNSRNDNNSARSILKLVKRLNPFK